MVFVHTGDANFDFNKCSLFTEYYFYLSRRFKLSESLLIRFPTLPLGEFPPLKSTGDGSIYIPSNLQMVEIFSSVSIAYLNLQLKTIPQVKEKLAHTVFPAFLQEVGRGGVKLCNVG